MTNDDAYTDDEQALAEFLAEPGVWADAPEGMEDSIVAAIAAEAATMPTGRAEAGPANEAPVGVQDDGAADNVVSIWSARSVRRLAVMGAAAAATLIAGLVVFVLATGGTSGVELALEGTDLAPQARATAAIEETPIGTRIILDVSGLPPAEPGTYYEAWMRVDAEIGVSAGTFHVRGGDGELELWSAVPLEDYPLFTVTIQDEAVPSSSGVVVLRGRFDG